MGIIELPKIFIMRKMGDNLPECGMGKRGKGQIKPCGAGRSPAFESSIDPGKILIFFYLLQGFPFVTLYRLSHQYNH